MTGEAIQGKVVQMAPPIDDGEAVGSAFPYLIGEILNALIEAEGTAILSELIEDPPEKWTDIPEFLGEIQRALIRLEGTEANGRPRIEQLALQLAFVLAEVINRYDSQNLTHYLPNFKVFLEMSQGQTWMVIKPSSLSVDNQTVENTIRAQKDMHPYDTPVDDMPDLGLNVFALNYRTRAVHLYDPSKFHLENIQFFSS